MKFILGVIVGVVLLALVEFLWITRGGLNMSPSASPLPGERFLVNHAIATSMGRAAQDESPVPPDEANLLAGAKCISNTAAWVVMAVMGKVRVICQNACTHIFRLFCRPPKV